MGAEGESRDLVVRWHEISHTPGLTARSFDLAQDKVRNEILLWSHCSLIPFPSQSPPDIATRRSFMGEFPYYRYFWKQYK